MTEPTEPITHRRVHHHVEKLRHHLEQLRREHGPKSPDELAADHAATEAASAVGDGGSSSGTTGTPTP